MSSSSVSSLQEVKKEPGKCDPNERAGLWAGLAVTLTIALVAIIAFIVLLILFFAGKSAVEGALYNSNICETLPITSNGIAVLSSNTVNGKNVFTERPLKCHFFDIQPALPTDFPDEGFSQEIAIFCGQQVFTIEYFSENKNLYVPTGLEVAGKIYTNENAAPLFGYVGIDDVNRTMYVFYRGTITEEEWDFDFVIRQNLLGNQKTPQTVLFSLPVNLINWQCSSDTLVHSGFFDLFTQIQPQLHRIVEANLSRCDRIIVSGHSLGAAVASLSSVYLSSNLTEKPVYVYTFGKPRVGNVSYSQCIADHFFGRFYRIENEDDVVTAVPLSVMPNLSNNSHPFLYQHEGERVIYSSNWGSLQHNHSMNNYIWWLFYEHEPHSSSSSSL